MVIMAITAIIYPTCYVVPSGSIILREGISEPATQNDLDEWIAPQEKVKICVYDFSPLNLLLKVTVSIDSEWQKKKY